MPRYTTLFHDRFDSRRPSHGHPLSARDDRLFDLSARPGLADLVGLAGMARLVEEQKKRVTKIWFGNYFEEGIYNATIAHLSDLNLDGTPSFLDYGYPAAAPKKGGVPSVWISVIGQRSLYPLTVQPENPRKTGKTVPMRVSRPRRYVHCPAERTTSGGNETSQA